MKNELLIGVQVETNRAHGRSMLEGIADYALAHTDWRLESVEPKSLIDSANALGASPMMQALEKRSFDWLIDAVD